MAAIDDLAIQLANDTSYSIGNQLFKANLPPTPDNAIAILSRTGLQPSRYLPEKNPVFEVVIRDNNYSNGEAKLAQVRSSLQQKTPQTIGSTYFQYILLMNEGSWMTRDENGRDLWSITFACQTR